jgi:hypothetical protein
VRPGEPARLTTQWTLLGPPAAAIAFPCWPVGAPPVERSRGERARLCDLANALARDLFGHAADSTLIDTYLLRDGWGGGLWAQLQRAERAILHETGERLRAWRARPPSRRAMRATQRDLCARVRAALAEVRIDARVRPDFSCYPTTGTAPLAVHFRDRSLHGPETFAWDIGGDGTIESTERDPVFTFTEPGRYTICLRAANGRGGREFCYQNAIVVR